MDVIFYCPKESFTCTCGPRLSPMLVTQRSSHKIQHLRKAAQFLNQKTSCQEWVKLLLGLHTVTVLVLDGFDSVHIHIHTVSALEK